MTLVPNLEAYPKTVLLADGTKIVLRPPEPADRLRLLRLFSRLPEVERYYLRDDVTAPELIGSWTGRLDLEAVVPILALEGDDVIGDASLHRSRAKSRRHVGEIRVVVAPEYRYRGLGHRLIAELLEISADLDLEKVTFELAAQGEEPAIQVATSMGFQEVARYVRGVKDLWGNYQDLVVLEAAIPRSEAGSLGASKKGNV